MREEETLFWQAPLKGILWLTKKPYQNRPKMTKISHPFTKTEIPGDPTVGFSWNFDMMFPTEARTNVFGGVTPETA